MYQKMIKRILDILLAMVVLVISLPVTVPVWILLAVANNGKPFFFQKRPGKNEKVFKIVKFRTMNNKRDSQGKLLPDAERLTAVGRFVRKTSLDEIPQLINVLKGEMSLIGPRPLLVEYLSLYSEKQKRRHTVRPGITGWAQINGRNAISWRQKFEYDVWYVDHISLGLDLKILGKTILKVFKTEGINQDQQATVEPFRGDN